MVLEASQKKWMTQHDQQRSHYPSTQERLAELALMVRSEAAGPRASVVDGIKELGLPVPRSLRQAIGRLEPAAEPPLPAPTKSSPSSIRRQASRTLSKDSMQEQMINSKMLWDKMSASSSRTRRTDRKSSNSSGCSRRASVAGLPKIQESANRISFDELFGTALRRAARKRAETRDLAASTSLPTLHPHTIKSFKLQREWVGRNPVYGEDEVDADAKRKQSKAQTQQEKEKIKRLTESAVAALAGHTDVDDYPDDSKAQTANESSGKLEAKTTEDPPEVALMLRLPDVVAILDRILGDDAFSKEFQKRIELEFKRFQVDSEVHLDSLCTVASNLGYLMADEAKIQEIASSISEYSTLDFDEYKLFVSKYNAFEKKHIREVFESFDADKSGELETSEVREVLTALGCSPFKGTLERLISAVDADNSRSLDFKEFIALLVIYRSTEGFSHRDIRDMWRVFSRFAQVHPKRNVLRVPTKKLTDALIFMFGPQAAELARQLARKKTSLKRNKAAFGQKHEEQDGDEPAEDAETAEGLQFRQFVSWARRMKEAEIQEYVRQFNKFDESGDGALDVTEIKGLLVAMGYTPLRSTVRDLIAAVDQNNDGTVDLEEFLDVMEYFKRWDGFAGDQVDFLKTTFNKFKNEEDEIAAIQVRDILQSWGLDQNLRTIQEYIERVDVDGTHTLDFKEFLRLMRLFREAELVSVKTVFEKTVRDIAIENNEQFDNSKEHTFPVERLSDALQSLGYHPKACKKSGLFNKLIASIPKDDEEENDGEDDEEKEEDAEDDGNKNYGVEVDFDQFVEIADDCQKQWREKSKKRANFGDAEVHAFRYSFDLYDTDHSGEIDRDELTDLIKDLGVPLVTRADQARLVSMIHAARKAAAEAGVPEVDRGKITDPPLPVQFVVFLFLVRMVLKERENDQLSKEDEECLKLQFSKREIAGLRAMFSHWSMFNQCEKEDAKQGEEDTEEALSATLVSGATSVDGFVEFIKSLNKDLAKADQERLATNMERIMKEQQAKSKKVTFTLFMHMIRWMINYNFANIQDYLDFD